MNYLDLDIIQIHEALVSKKVTPLELTKEAIKRAKANIDNAFECILEKEALEFAKSLGEPEEDNYLWGIPYSLKDNFATKGIVTTGSSNMLVGYKPTYDSHVYEILKRRKAILIGKTTLDELGMGGTGTTGHLGHTTNPLDPSKEYQIGGSSCGSAVSVAARITPFSIGSDTGDSVRKPASFAALVGYKPTWGLISRHGLFSFCPSLDHVAFFTRTVQDSAIILSTLSEYDEHDATSYQNKRDNYLAYKKTSYKLKKVAVVKEILETMKDHDVIEAFSKLINKLVLDGYIIEYVSVPKELLKAIFPSYLVITCSEATSNNANLDGIKFGPRPKEAISYQDVMNNARTTGFGYRIKQRFVYGSYALLKENQQNTYLKAKRARRLIVEAFQNIFKEYAFIIAPATISSAPKLPRVLGPKPTEKERLSDTYLIGDNYLAFANFGGFPSITIPLGFKENMPFGVNITSDIFQDTSVFGFASVIEEILRRKN